MEMEGKWWVLYEEESINIERSRVYDLNNGQVRDGRNGEVLGHYAGGADETVITLHDRPGDNTVIKIRAGTASEPSDGFTADWTTSGFELYRENWPIPENETDGEEFARLDWEDGHFISVTYGYALRDGPDIEMLHGENQRDPVKIIDPIDATIH